MSYTIKLLRETRFSIKILIGKLCRLLLTTLYNIILAARYATFPKSCQNLSVPSITYSDGSWVERKTTKDLRNIQEFLLAQNHTMNIFQAGIGNSSLFDLLQNKVGRFVGVTIAQEEVDYAKDKFPNDFGGKYIATLSNKYTSDVICLGKDFDYIIDNDLSSYACCHNHFHLMLDAYRNMLKPDGAILVGFMGLGYFDSGFGLSENRMAKIAAEHGLAFEKTDYCYCLKRIA